MDIVTAPESEIYAAGPYRVVVKQPDPQKKQVILQSPDVVHVLPVTRHGTIVLLRQKRYGAGCRVLEAPAGGIDAGETPIEAARRELREELGYACDELVRVGTPGAFSSPGLLSERSTLFVARGCAAGADAGEEIPRVEMSPADALALVSAPGADAAAAPHPEAVVADVKTMLLLVLAEAAGLI